ncbi:glycosyltransferase family 4 protein, partial [bacterium]|nr:glycosyltransferase family 4 protein [bacterium]
MKILFSTVLDMSEQSSPRHHVDSVIKNWENQGHDVKLIHPGNTIGRQYKEEEISNKFLLILERTKKDWEFGQAIANEIRQQGCDIVYHRFASSAIFPILRSKLLWTTLILEVNADLDSDLRGSWGSAPAMRNIIKFLAFIQYLAADHIIVVSEGIKNSICKGHSFLKSKVSVVPNGADLEVFHPLDVINSRHELGLNENQSIVSFTGKVHVYQGIETIIQAAKVILEGKFPVKFILVGEGSNETQLKKLVQEYGLSSSVIFTGWCSPQETALYLGASDICLAPYTREVLIDPNQSQTYDAVMKGSPLKIFSYMAAGRPVIASHFAEAGIFVEKRGAGIAIEPENPSILAQEILNLLNDKERLREKGENARHAAEADLGWDQTAEKIATICHKVINDQ